MNHIFLLNALIDRHFVICKRYLVMDHLYLDLSVYLTIGGLVGPLVNKNFEKGSYNSLTVNATFLKLFFVLKVC